MLNHNIRLDSKYCHLRPLVWADENNVLDLWNQDYVVGRLFMSRTSMETYRRYFKIYEHDPDNYRFAVEDSHNKFVGTVAFTRKDNKICEIGMLALHPTRDPVLVVLQVMLLDYLFHQQAFREVWFTVHPTNGKIKKVHKFFGAINTGRVTEKKGSNGLPIRLEHWKYIADDWASRKEALLSLLV